MSSISDHIESVKRRIEAAAKRANRNPDEITLIAVSKTRTVDEIQAALSAGISDLGENRVQEFGDKYEALADSDATFHLIGHLQRNKVKHALDYFHMIHSVDSLRLAKEIQKRASKAERVVEVLVQVNTSGEDSKYGVAPEQAEPLIEQIREFPHLKVKGLMTIGAFVDDMEIVRPMFRQLREMREQFAAKNWPTVEMTHLSMGMTNDFETAIEEGATMVRIGTAIFGERDYA